MCNINIVMLGLASPLQTGHAMLIYQQLNSVNTIHFYYV